VINIISLGAGVQSSTMALMAAHGEIEPMPDCAIFADTGAEPQEVYDWLKYLKPLLPFPVYEVSKGNLTDDVGTVKTSEKTGQTYMKGLIPAFIHGHGLLGRQCTADYKVMPVRKKIRELAGITGKQCKEVVCSQWMGISTDEIQRMKVSVEKWYEFRYPLIDMGMSRTDCFQWMKGNGYPEPPRSACAYCPFHSDDEWERIKAMPAEWQTTIDLERKIQASALLLTGTAKLRGKPTLHRSGVNIDKVGFNNPDFYAKLKRDTDPQLDFIDECEGMCGL
jgi:hypothetical protein